MGEEEQKARVKALFQQGIRPGEKSIRHRQAIERMGQTVIIHGGLHQYAPPLAKVVVVTPRALISRAQKKSLEALCDQWVDLHNIRKARPITRADARKALNARANVKSHRLIAAARYTDLVAWITRKITRLEDLPTMEVINIETRRSGRTLDPDGCRP